MESEHSGWILTEHTPLCLVLAPNALYEKIKYLRWTDALLDTVSDAESLTPIYRHNLYESWTVFFWGYLEALSEEVCDELERQAQNTVRLRRSDINAKSKWESVSKYIELVRNEEFLDANLKATLDDYRIARNICAHDAGGRVDEVRSAVDGRKHTFVKIGGGFQQLSKKETASLARLPGIEIEQDTYRLTKEFCESLLKFGMGLVRELQRVSSSLGERSTHTA